VDHHGVVVPCCCRAVPHGDGRAMRWCAESWRTPAAAAPWGPSLPDRPELLPREQKNMLRLIEIQHPVVRFGAIDRAAVSRSFQLGTSSVG
jgi:hypothetical protein